MRAASLPRLLSAEATPRAPWPGLPGPLPRSAGRGRGARAASTRVFPRRRTAPSLSSCVVCAASAYPGGDAGCVRNGALVEPAANAPRVGDAHRSARSIAGRARGVIALGRMSRGHRAAQRFLLKQPAQPLGTSLMTAAEKWAERKGWRGGQDGSPGSPGSLARRRAVPRAACEAMRRAVRHWPRRGSCWAAR